ncbi:acyltransferase family protein [Enterovirga aerilata]|uniref:acyltransferase family protein n=1 Tax=Enterovirga aerilata TaxID=2730920 RepID=UPI003211D4E8
MTYARRGETDPASSPSGRPDPDGARVAWVDTAKGICIILVVMMHSTLGVGAEMGREGFMHWVVAFAKPFRMPDFFLVSGLFLGRVIARDWRSYADKRVVHFFYFYLLWLVIQSAAKYGQVSGGSPLGFLQHLAHGLYEPYSTLWFIYILAVFSVVTKLVRHVSAPVLLGGAALLQILPIETGSFLLDEFCERWVYFLAGYLLSARIFALAAWAPANPGPALIGIAIWAVVNGALALTPTSLGGVPTLAELPVVGLLLGLAGAVAIVAAASILTSHMSRAAEPLRYCGQNSIAIYLAFFLPMAATRTVLIKTGIIQDAGLVSLFVLIAAVAAPLILERLVRHTPLAFLFRRPAWAHIVPVRPALRLQPAE